MNVDDLIVLGIVVCLGGVVVETYCGLVLICVRFRMWKTGEITSEDKLFAEKVK